MSTPAIANLTKVFPLDADVLGTGSAATLKLTGSTDADVLAAVAANTPFPSRPTGRIDLGHIGLSVQSGNVTFKGDGTTVGVGFSAGVSAGAAIFDTPSAAFAALDLGETPGLHLAIDPTGGTRYALLRAGYTASARVSGSHPIGTVGSFTFGASAAASGLTAVLHRFPVTAGADSVLKATVHSWKLPTHLRAANQLAPGTWVITEASGTLSVSLGAKLGYDFSFVRQAKNFGLSGDIGLKIDAAATATFGFGVSGRYLIVVGRESDDAASTKLRLRIFKLSSSNMNFGLNLKLGVTGVATLLPGTADEFVSAVFGVHGSQIVGLLGKIEQWTDPNADVGALVAGLANTKALELIQEVTGVDPKAAFEAARGKLLSAIRLYQSLPGRVSSELLGVLKDISAPATADLLASLKLLAADAERDRRSALASLLNTTGFSASPIGRILTALGDHGLLNLFDRLPELRTTSTTLISILSGGEIAKLQGFINRELGLDKVIAAVTKDDFDTLDSFLVGRLSHFFDKTLRFEDLQEVRTAIHTVISKREEVYSSARKALNSRYGAEITAAWQRTSADTAVIDAEFDPADPAAQTLLEAVMQGGDTALNALFTTSIPSVHLNMAVLTHELTCRSSLQVTLPFFHFQTESFTTAIAKVSARDEDGRVLIYDVTGSNEVSVRNKFNSSLALSISNLVARAGTTASFPDLRINPVTDTTWTYRLLYQKATIKREELEAITRPFLEEHLGDHFSGATSLSTWYDMLESTSEDLLKNRPEVFGDVCASFEVTFSGDVLGAWLKPIGALAPTEKLRQAAVLNQSKAVSLAIQRKLKETLLFFYLSDISKLNAPSVAGPLLAWASLPPAVKFDEDGFSETGGNDVFWDNEDITLRRAAARSGQTIANLRLKLPALRLRMQEAGFSKKNVDFYLDSEAGSLANSATSPFGDNLFRSLLSFESRIVNKANEALKEVQSALKDAGKNPTAAKDQLAEFAFDITKAFNQLLGNSVFANLASFRGVAQVVFAEASRALDPSIAGTPRAMLTLDILKPAPPREFVLSTFQDGAVPAATDIAVSQRLVSL